MKAQLATTVDNLRLAKIYVQSPDWWAEQKIDGQRFIVRVANGNVRAFNRKGVEMTIPQPVLADFSDGTFDSKRWTFDGELLDGELYIFDLLEAVEDYCDMPYQKRREKLENIFSLWTPDHCHLLPVAKTEEQKAELVISLVRERAEGAMFKQRSACYVPGKRVDAVKKMKIVETADVVVMELQREGKPLAVTVGMMSPAGELVEVCGCKVPEAVAATLEVNDVIEVRYLYATKDNKLTQPVFLRVRTDKTPEECVMDMKYASKKVLPTAW